MLRDTLERRLTVALSNLLVEDWRLLTVQALDSRAAVSEGSVAFALGWQVRSLIDRTWDVDCEYNRAGEGENAQVKRRDDSVVRPDLIVHRRGLRGLRNNLLALELKTDAERQHHEGGSVESLLEVARLHDYQHAVFLDMGVRQGAVVPRWTWIQAGTVASEAEVYTPQALSALTEQGRSEARRRYEN